uniref:UDENN domain-containing protein n=1 Tax=Fundulus heteroclitus TaxID=8078 RepID=A0A3Q2P7A0_FUNHE
LLTVPKFCFPFMLSRLSPCSLTINQVGQNFTFVLTDIESKQRFGFCRLSSGAHTCYCILSYLPWFEVFYKLLNILADCTVKCQVTHNSFLSASVVAPCTQGSVVSGTTTDFSPPPRKTGSMGLASKLFNLQSVWLPQNLIETIQDRNLTEYFVAVDVNNMLHLYASMLYERRILICCSKLSTVSSTSCFLSLLLHCQYWTFEEFSNAIICLLSVFYFNLLGA